MGEEYQLDGKTVVKVYESHRGDYWVITDDSGRHPFGYACLAGMPDAFNEWGTINADNLRGTGVWEVPEENWPFTGPDDIDIVEA
jgi:hypothetical protein